MPSTKSWKKPKGWKFASYGGWAALTAMNCVWNFVSWAGTGHNEITATCSSRDAGERTGFELGLHKAVLPPPLAQTALKKTQGEGEKRRDILSWSIPWFLTGSENEVRDFKVYLSWEIWSFGFPVPENLDFIRWDRYDALWNRKDKWFTDIFCIEMI